MEWGAMTQEEWNDCADPVPMLGLLRNRASDHRLRLFICACCRRVWSSLPPGEQRMYEAVEAFAGGGASLAAVAGAYDDAVEGQDSLPHPLTTLNATRVAVSTAQMSSDIKAESRFQANLVRCLFGGPTGPVKMSLSWRTDTVMALARQIHESREFGAMPILADALQDAGCESESILTHCREAKVHVRGCFVLDSLLRERL
jgi:hypothetical protein